MFRYQRDPLFLGAACLYLLNRRVLKRFVPWSFLSSHFNDLICIPFLVPLVLWIARRLRLRCHDLPPRSYEVLIPLGIWSILFEIVLPQSTFWSQWATGDPLDVFWYAVGGTAGLTFWRWWYQPSRIES